MLALQCHGIVFAMRLRKRPDWSLTLLSRHGEAMREQTSRGNQECRQPRQHSNCVVSSPVHP